MGLLEDELLPQPPIDITANKAQREAATNVDFFTIKPSFWNKLLFITIIRDGGFSDLATTIYFRAFFYCIILDVHHCPYSILARLIQTTIFSNNISFIGREI
nr:MAG TPA: hypothetical protein [Caudoviricetes sp.]